jgi:GNAT superfamily N-acetyltransferase
MTVPVPPATQLASYTVEHLSDGLIAELMPLLRAHWREVAHYSDLELNPDWDAYRKMESLNRFVVMTARAEGQRLVGYLAVFIAPSLHYRPAIFAHQDVLYVEPGMRARGVGEALLRYAQDVLKHLGVTVLYQHGKARHDLNIGPFLTRRLGYELVDEIYALRLDRE